MNALVPPNELGEHVLQGGRRYRMLVVVNGTCYVDELEDVLAAAGLTDIGASSPDEWEEHRPPNWPTESPLPETAANECLLRVSASYPANAGEALRFERDVPIGDRGATFTIVRTWDYGPIASQRTGGGASAEGDAGSGRGAALGVAIAGVAGIAAYNWWSNKRRAERQARRLESPELREQRLALEQAVGELMAAGASQDEAESIVLEQLEAAQQPKPVVVVVDEQHG